MDDRKIIELFWQRSEKAIDETNRKYGKYCLSIAYGILRSREDSEECLSDAYLRLWRSIPPSRPDSLRAFLAKVIRNLALDRLSKANAQKRGSGELSAALSELGDCVPNSCGDIADDLALTVALESFLASLQRESRIIFLRRYWYMNTIREIASSMSLSESKVKMSLMRSRNSLRQFLEKEGFRL